MCSGSATERAFPVPTRLGFECQGSGPRLYGDFTIRQARYFLQGSHLSMTTKVFVRRGMPPRWSSTGGSDGIREIRFAQLFFHRERQYAHIPTRHRMHRHHLSSQAESTTRKIDGLFARNSATRTGEGKVCGGRINGIFSLELHFAHFGSEATELYQIEFVDACPGDVCPRVGWDSQRSFEGFAEYEMMTR